MPIVLAFYFLLPHRARIVLLLAASCFFYMVYRPVYILVLAALILIDYCAARGIEGATRPRARILLWASVTATCCVLFFFKYYNFAASSFASTAGLLGFHIRPPVLSYLLPIGLSFHTFQSLAYVIEVYRGNQPAERNLLTYATYVMFFPQLVAGPIERPAHLLRQFREYHKFDMEQVTAGMKRIAWGLYKKAVVADRLGVLVKPVFENPEEFNGVCLTLAMVAFTYQIYCDFSGYSDIAIGSAQLLGFRLVENFDSPFAARSIGEFWRRWHISLSTWFRDYVYIPLGGSRGSEWHTARNLMITFLLSGLWHGASWNFLVWGGLNGAYLIAGRSCTPLRNRFASWLGLEKDHPLRVIAGVLLTFSFTCAAFVIFRSTGLRRAAYILTHFFRDFHFRALANFGLDEFQAKLALPAILFLELVQWMGRRPERMKFASSAPASVRWACYVGLVAVILGFGVYLDADVFIYFQF